MANQPDMDFDLVYLWDHYITLQKGCERISFTEVEAYQRLTGVVFNPWEVAVIFGIDEIRRKNG